MRSKSFTVYGGIKYDASIPNSGPVFSDIPGAPFFFGFLEDVLVKYNRRVSFQPSLNLQLTILDLSFSSFD